MTKDKIKTAARELFAAKGYDDTSMEDIAKEVGIKKPSLYAHYSGKESILQDIVDDVINEYSENISAVTEPGEGQEVKKQLSRIFVGLSAYFSDETTMSLWSRLFLFPPSFLKDEILNRTVAVDMAFLERLNDIFAIAIADGELQSSNNTQDMALAFYYMLYGYLLCSPFYKNGAETDNGQKCLNILLKGLESR